MACVQVENHDTVWNVTSLEFWFRHLNILLSLYFGKFEVYQVIGSPLDYFTDIFNVFNSAQIVLNILICMSYGYNWDLFSAESVYLLMAICSFCGFINCFYWMRFFDATSRYVRMMLSAIAQIRDFLMIQFVFIAAFGFGVYFLNQGTEYVKSREPPKGVEYHERFDSTMSDALYDSYMESEKVEVFEGYFTSSSVIVSSLFNQYVMLVGGNYETEQYEKTPYPNSLWIFWALSAFISQVVILNMLVNILGDSQAQFEEKKEQSTLQEKIQNLCDYKDVIVTKPRVWTHLVQLSNSEMSGSEEWAGQLKAIKKAIAQQVGGISSLMSKKIGALNSRIDYVAKCVQEVSKVQNGVRAEMSNK